MTQKEHEREINFPTNVASGYFFIRHAGSRYFSLSLEELRNSICMYMLDRYSYSLDKS